MFTTINAPIQQRSGRVESRSGTLIAVVTSLHALSTAVLAARLWIRLRIQRMGLAADDWTIIASWLFTVVQSIDICLQTKYGLGKHLADLPPGTDVVMASKLSYPNQSVYFISVSLTKISILFFYFRLFPQRTYRIFLWVMMVFVGLTGLICSLADIFQCNPVHKAWDSHAPGTCINRPAFFFANAGLNIFQDLVIYLLPSPILWNVHLPARQRIALIGIFVVGGFVCVTGIMRIPTLSVAVASEDPTWDHYGSAIWSSIECNSAIICASLVHFKPLLTRASSSILGASHSSRTGRMVKLSDERSKNLASGDVKTFGQRQGSRPVGILTEIELEDMSRSRCALVPGSHAGGSTATVTCDEETPFPRGMDQANAIYATTHFTVAYDDRQGLNQGVSST
ncbi:hypothetical protein F5Y06DRAFT_300499 [Hypoxylon sp. FL0890]|nr:hypothetical protein F5Y06DRAFT_300499 [Hypoxylon sp. FL0890]